jgi:hypothetical protein
VTDIRRSLVAYLAATGWQPPAEPGAQGELWRNPDYRYAVPVPESLDDGGPDWELVLDRLALVEDAKPDEVERRIRGRLVDVANLRAAKDLVIEDTIPLVAGVSMVRDSWVMLRSCATTSLGARPHIAGNYRKAGDGLVGLARMAHTRRGSFIIPIYMPVPPPEELPDQIAGLETAPPESGERRVMRTFAQSLSLIASVVTPESEPSPNDVQEMIHAGVSHEFAAGLTRILRNESVAEFTADFEWAALAGPAPSTPRHVAIPAAAASRIERVSRRLKSEKPARGIEMLTGPIVGVQLNDDNDGGVVTIHTVRGARPCHVSVNVSLERLDQALDWMKQRSTAIVTGRVHRSGASLFSDSRDSVGLLAHGQLFADES